MNAHLETIAASTSAAADNGLGAPAPFGEIPVDRLAVLGSAADPILITIWIDTTVSIV